MRRLFISLMLTLTAFIANAQPSAIAPQNYQQMLKKGIDVDWWGRSEKNKYGAYSETAVKRFAQQGIKHVRFRLHHYRFTDEDFKRLFSQINTCMQNNLIPIIAFSAKPYKENPNAGEHEKVVEWWKMMAEKCKELSPMVSFYLLLPLNLNLFCKNIYKRQHIIISAVHWGSIHSLEHCMPILV